MSHLEQSIRDAHATGSYFKGYSIEFMYGGPMREQRVIGVLFDPDGDAKVALTETEILLQPHFWSALGKARGWGYEKKWQYNGAVWLESWHRFIDHLADGKDAESFFATLK
jgi:hypothetical protein